jgi:hypothetical protein
VETLAIVAILAVVVLWLRMRKLERAQRQHNPSPEPSPPSALDTRVAVLERAERARSVRELKS